MRRSLLLIIGLTTIFATNIQAQLGLIPLRTNSVIESFIERNPGYIWNQPNKLFKWGTDDTLDIPFFEDFTSTTIYPDSTRWRNNQVYVNSDFPINPPSYGVATFDFLTDLGAPYSPLEPLGIRAGDTLTSQAINLSDSSGSAYDASDSFFFSFFYQCRGLGDLITDDDSMRLEFLGSDGKWSLVWTKGGDQIREFRQVIFPIINSKYFHKAFQFRFLNMTHLWGNNNHWHLDYIYLNNHRGINDIYNDDYAIQSKPTSLLKTYSSMPYDHFLNNTSLAADSIFFNVSNRNKVTINALVRHVEKNDGNTLVSTNFNDNAANIPGDGFAKRKVEGYGFAFLSGLPVVIDRTYEIIESGRVNPVLFQGNDKIEVQQVFERYYAYDDGSAESGFGFNDLRDGEGQVAISFDIAKADSLIAIGMHLTHNINDLSKERFTLKIWQDLDQDIVLFERIISTDSLRLNPKINGYYIIGLDSTLYVNAGKIYVGWSQDRNYNLGVGFDKNNGYLAGGVTMNKNIFFNIGDGWLPNSNAALSGAPMIRPIFGATEPWSTSVNDVENTNFQLYPNPVQSVLNLSKPYSSIRVFNTLGKQVDVKWIDSNTLNVNNLSPGVYYMKIQFQDQTFGTRKFVKSQ